MQGGGKCEGKAVPMLAPCDSPPILIPISYLYHNLESTDSRFMQVGS